MKIKSKLAIGFGALALVAAGTTMAVASIPDGNGVVHGCRQNTTGNFRVIDSASESCLTGETDVDWDSTPSVTLTSYVKDVSTSAGSPNADCDSGDLLLTAAGTINGTPVPWNDGSYRVDGSGDVIGVTFAANAQIDLVCLNN